MHVCVHRYALGLEYADEHEKLVAEWERCSGGRWDRYAPLPPLGEADVFARAHRDCMRHYLIAC